MRPAWHYPQFREPDFQASLNVSSARIAVANDRAADRTGATRPPGLQIKSWYDVEGWLVI